jgi:hypothetical protein
LGKIHLQDPIFLFLTGGFILMKITITAKEAMDRGIWTEVMQLFGREKEDETWPNEEFILTEEQARKLGILH